MAIPAAAARTATALVLALAAARATAQDHAELSLDTAATRDFGFARPPLLVEDEQTTNPDFDLVAPFVRALPGVPDHADLVALERDPQRQLRWFALDTTVALPDGVATLLVRPRDLAVYDEAGANYAIALTGEALGVPDGVAIDAVARDGTGAFLLSFDGWFETGGRLLRPDALYRFDPALGAYDAAPAFDPATAQLGDGISASVGINLDVADAPRPGSSPGGLLLGFDAWATASGSIEVDDPLVLVVDAATGTPMFATTYDVQLVATGAEVDLDALWTGTRVDPLFTDGFED